MREKELLTPEQRNLFMSIPDDITEHDMETHYTFTSEDLEFINKHRRDHNRLGIALQLAVLRYPGWTLFQIKNVPYHVLAFVSKQIKVSPQEYIQYGQRVATRNEHLEELRQHYGYQNLCRFSKFSASTGFILILGGWYSFFFRWNASSDRCFLPTC